MSKMQRMMTEEQGIEETKRVGAKLLEVLKGEDPNVAMSALLQIAERLALFHGSDLRTVVNEMLNGRLS